MLCESLSDEFDVEVIAGMPNHTDTESPLKYGRAQHNNVTINRVRHTRFSKHSIIGRLTNLVTFTMSACLASLRKSKVEAPDIVITETDPFFLPLLGPWLKWRYNNKFVAYLQDVYPDVAIAVGKAKEGFIVSQLRKSLVKAYNKSDRVIVLSPNMLARCERNGVASEKMTIVHNWANCETVFPVKQDNPFRATHHLNNKFVVMYSGNLGMAHVLSPLIEAATNLKDHSEIHFMLIGEGVHKEQLEVLAKERNLSNVTFLSYQPKSQLANSLSAADVHVVSMLPAAEGCVMPSKLYGILAAGTAVISLCEPTSDVSKIVNAYQLGVVCDPSDTTTVAQRLTDTILAMEHNRTETERQGRSAREVCLKKYDQSLQLKKFAVLFRALLEGTAQPVEIGDPAQNQSEELTSCEC